jgi:Domain of Unknown Function (DUF930)
MLKFIAFVVPVICFAMPSFALDPAIKKQLQKLDPEERMEQSCDTEAMSQISKKEDTFKPDKVIAYTFKDPVLGKDSINAPGAVFRSHGDWYHLSYHCVTGPHHINVRSLSYEIGAKVPRDKWDKYYLYN